MRSIALQRLIDLSMANKRERYPNVPVEWLPRPNYKPNTANGLTKCIIDFLRFNGWQAERINNTGRMYQGKWIPGTGTNGTADISATVKGRSVKIEVKIGRDRQSLEQLKYQSNIERAGGLYVIAKEFDGFYSCYVKTFEP